MQTKYYIVFSNNQVLAIKERSNFDISKTCDLPQIFYDLVPAVYTHIVKRVLYNIIPRTYLHIPLCLIVNVYGSIMFLLHVRDNTAI